MSKEEFKKYWEVIPKANESSVTIENLYGAFTQSNDVANSLIEGLAKNSIINLARTVKNDT
jgi:ureidoglycolate hydrolase